MPLSPTKRQKQILVEIITHIMIKAIEALEATFLWGGAASIYYNIFPRFYSDPQN